MPAICPSGAMARPVSIEVATMRAHGHQALGGAIDAPDDRAERGEAEGERDEIDRERAPEPRLGRGGRERVDIAVPIALPAPLGAGDLDRIESGDGLDQDRVLLRALPVRGFRGFAHRHLHDEADRDDERDHDQRHDGDRPGDQRDHEDEQEQERQIDDRGERRRGEEVPQRLELRDIVREGARGLRRGVHSDAEHMLEDARRDLAVERLAGCGRGSSRAACA